MPLFPRSRRVIISGSKSSAIHKPRPWHGDADVSSPLFFVHSCSLQGRFGHDDAASRRSLYQPVWLRLTTELPGRVLLVGPSVPRAVSVCRSRPCSSRHSGPALAHFAAITEPDAVAAIKLRCLWRPSRCRNIVFGLAAPGHRSSVQGKSVLNSSSISLLGIAGDLGLIYSLFGAQGYFGHYCKVTISDHLRAAAIVLAPSSSFPSSPASSSLMQSRDQGREARVARATVETFFK